MIAGKLGTYLHSFELAYTGRELRPHFLLSQFGLKGSAVGAFVGGCRVETEALVDWEDRLENERIEAKSMLHFIGEFFGFTLSEGVWLQRLFIAILREEMMRMKPDLIIERRGDDLFAGGGGKVSVSIVTATPVSVLLHTGLNIDPTGAPVRAAGLQEFGIDPPEFARKVLRAVENEWESAAWACVKVKPMLY